MSETRLANLFYLAVGLTLIVRLILAQVVPLTGDEAYFFIWAKYPDYGFYDHPPMVGWLLSLVLFFGDARWLLRLPSVLLAIGISLYMVQWLKPRLGEAKAYWAGLLFLLAPISVSNVFITTDTPLVLFAFIASVLFVKALQHEGYRYWLLSGLMLGLAFLSKYFAVLLGVTFGLYVLIYRRNRRDLLGLLFLFLAVLPSVFVNVWWNYNHCWDNILFNLINRHDGSESGQAYVGSYLIMMIYLVMPPLLWYGWKRRGDLLRQLRRGEGYLFLWLAPMLLFFLLSFYARIGLHWILAFYPFLFLAVAQILETRQLRFATLFGGAFALIHVIGLVVLLNVAPAITAEKPVTHHDVIFGLKNDEFVRQIDAAAGDFHRATDSYTYSAILEHTSGVRYAVMGDGSKYGRQDDIITDWRTLDGENIAMLIYKESSVPYYSRFFEHYSVTTITVDGVSDYLLLGQNFHYQKYRDTVLNKIKRKFYRFPEWLPCRECYFYKRYFPDEPYLRSEGR